MSAFTLGSYVPYNSSIHKMDPRIKILGTILLMVCVFLDFSNIGWVMSFAMTGLCFVFISILLALSKTGFRKIISSLKSLWFMLIILLVIYCFMPYSKPTLGVAFSINGYKVYWDAFAQAGKIILRLVMMIELTMILTSSTKPLDLTYALEWYMSPLKLLGFPAHEIAMTISIALRFIPTLLDDTERVMKAQSSRGVDFENGGFGKKVRGIVSLIIPLFVSAFMRSEELANAMECRGYDPRGKRTRYRKLSISWRDIIGLLLLLAFFGFFLFMSISRIDPFSAWFGIKGLL